MKKIFVYATAIATMFGLARCSNNDGLNTSDGALNQSTIDVAETSGQLASGSSFRISGSSTDSTTSDNKHGGHGSFHERHHGILDGVDLLAPTQELLTIIDAESAADFRGLRISKNGGATITHYDSGGNIINLPLPTDGPNGCSLTGGQFPAFDSLIAKIAKTVIDFGTGVTFHRDTISITRAGKIIITRNGNSSTLTETTTFENYSVNGNKIEGTKTRLSIYEKSTGKGTSTTTVTGGKITFTDGTAATWTSNKKRDTNITLNSDGIATAGEITTEVATDVTTANGTVIYAHQTTKPLIEDLSCKRNHRGPVSGTLKTIYRDDTVIVDFGDGSCDNNNISITVNGVTTTKTIKG
jgi:hypothetical protein